MNCLRRKQTSGSVRKYQNVKKQLEENLAIKRREAMNRRRHFYNVDNEINLEENEEYGPESGERNNDALDSDDEAHQNPEDESAINPDNEKAWSECDFISNEGSNENKLTEDQDDDEVGNGLFDNDEMLLSGENDEHGEDEENEDYDSDPAHEDHNNPEEASAEDTEKAWSERDFVSDADEGSNIDENGNRENLERSKLAEDNNDSIVRELFDDEASLSGDDVGSDDGEEDEDNEEYEPEEGDNDVFDPEEVRENIVMQYLKQTSDEEDRRLLLLQEQFFADSDLHGQGSVDRSFRLRMRDDLNVDWEKLLGNIEGDELADQLAEDAEHEQTDTLQERHVEMLKWRLEQEKKQNANSFASTESAGESYMNSTLFELGEKIIKAQRKTTISTTIQRRGTRVLPGFVQQNHDVYTECDLSPSMVTKMSTTTTKRRRDSLLNIKDHRRLAVILKEFSSSKENHLQHTLFTSTSKNKSNH